MPTTDPCGLDTSVVLRLLTGEPREQAEKALAFLRDESAAGRRPVVSDLVVTEAYVALHHHFGVPKSEALHALSDLLENGLVKPENGGCAPAVLRQMKSSGHKPGFVDHVIYAQYASRKNRLATFEKASAKLPRTIVL